MNTLPLTVALNVEGMKHGIIHAFTQHQLELTDTLQRQLDYLLREENIMALVTEEAGKILRDTIRSAVQSAVYRALGDPEVRALTDGIVRSALLATFGKIAEDNT